MSELQRSGGAGRLGAPGRARGRMSGPERDEGRPMRLLIVHDEPDQAERWKSMLSREPAFRCEIAWRLETALTLLDTVSFDAVLLDPNLPDSQGPATVREMLAAAPRVAIVVVGSLDDSDETPEYIEAGARD